MGNRLIAALLPRGHALRALVRKGSEGKLPPGCEVVVGDPLDGASYAARVPPCDTFVQLVGVTHPNPSKAAEFRAVDFGSAQAAVKAAVEAGVQHFVYVSVAQPAPVMKFYVQVRAECEEMIHALVRAIEDPARGIRILEVPAIRQSHVPPSSRILHSET